MPFGPDQISNPTPAWATWMFRIVLYVATLGNVYVTTFTNLTPETKDLIVGISSFVTIAVHLASRSFGVPLPDDAKIPAKDVASLKTDQPEIKN